MRVYHPRKVGKYRQSRHFSPLTHQKRVRLFSLEVKVRTIWHTRVDVQQTKIHHRLGGDGCPYELAAAVAGLESRDDRCAYHGLDSD